MRRRRLTAAASMMIWLTGCQGGFEIAAPPDDVALYSQLYPYYAELCAVSQIEKKPGFGVDTSGGIGGHTVFYLNGACREGDADYPTLVLCTDKTAVSAQGVGLSVNAHFQNANWVATEGRDFFFNGDLSPGERLTKTAYDRTQAKAEKMGIYKGVVFHPEVYDDQPAGMGRQDFEYEVSIATDYAISFGRDRYCGRVPVSRGQMTKMIDYLNATNAIYRDGKKEFEWNVLENNCSHLAHNALAAAGIWDEWETDRFFLISAFDFPVPKNEFVNLMRRTNDFDISDPRDVFDDDSARQSLIENERLPMEPGALAEAVPVQQANDIYDTQPHLIFYDNPVIGPYEYRFEDIFSEPRYTDIKANLLYFDGLYRSIKAERLSSSPLKAGRRENFAAFATKFYDYVDRQSVAVSLRLASITKLAPGGVNWH